MLILTRDVETERETFYFAGKDGSNLVRGKTISPSDDWHIDVKNSVVRVVSQAGLEIKVTLPFNKLKEKSKRLAVEILNLSMPAVGRYESINYDGSFHFAVLSALIKATQFFNTLEERLGLIGIF